MHLRRHVNGLFIPLSPITAMPLPAPASRKLMHRRTVECHGYQRDDGLWDVEGHMIDTKTFDVDLPHRGTVKPGEHFHEMWVRLTVDVDLLVHDACAVTDFSPHAGCPDLPVDFSVLKGLTIKPGWQLKSRELLGGAKGCTHLVELLGPVATTAYQTLYPVRALRPHDPERRPALINSCHTYRADGPMVMQRWPKFYTGPRE